MKFHVKKIYSDAKLPERAHASDAGIDIFAYEDTVVSARSRSVIGTGIQASLGEGYVALVWDKSSVGSKGIKTLGGVIDAGYRGEYKVVVANLTDEDYLFKKGDKVAQILIQKVELCEVLEVSELEDGDRGDSGFGSTGV